MYLSKKHHYVSLLIRLWRFQLTKTEIATNGASASVMIKGQGNAKKPYPLR
jgi:hypothetical protein